jgi:hypothetical protein
VSRLRSRAIGPLGCLLAALTLSPWVGAAPSAPPSSSPLSPPALTSPFDFAPSPLPLPSAEANQQRQLSALLKGFAPIQQAQSLFSGEAGKDLALQLIIKCRPGYSLDAVTLQSLTRLVCAGVPGLAPERLNVADSAGRLLITGGVVAVSDSPSSLRNTGPWLALALILIAGLGCLWLIKARRSPAPVGVLDRLITEQPRALARLLREERSEVAGVLLATSSARLSRRLQRALQAERIVATLPSQTPDSNVATVVAEALSDRLT